MALRSNNRPVPQEVDTPQTTVIGAISDELIEHAEKLKQMRDEAADDDQGDDSFSSRASVFTAYTRLLQEILKVQEQAANMGRIMALEATIVDTVKEFLTEEQMLAFRDELEEKLLRLEGTNGS